MNADGKSEDFVLRFRNFLFFCAHSSGRSCIPAGPGRISSTRANKAVAAVAESVEERESSKGSADDSSWTFRTQNWDARQLDGTAATTGNEPSLVIVWPNGGAV